MPFKQNNYFKPANGRYLGVFVGTEDGPPQTHKKDDGRVVTEGTMLWNFQIYDLQTRQPIINPMTGQSPAVAQGMSSETVGIGKNGVPAKARTWMSALLATVGRIFDDDIDPNVQIASVLNAQVILNFGRSQTGKDGTLLGIEPPAPVQPAAVAAPAPATAPPTPEALAPAPDAPAPVAVAVGAVAAIPPVE